MSGLSHLDELEAEAIYIIREVAAECEKPVMLYSIGKDSSVMLHLALKAFYPEKPPFPFLHVNTTWKFKEMIEFRDKTAKELGIEMLEYINEDGVKQGMPLVICVALGTSFGGHNGDSLLADILDIYATVRNRCVVVGTGNEAARRHHYFNRFTDAQDMRTAEIRVGEGTQSFAVELWSTLPNIVMVSVTSPSGERTGMIPIRLGYLFDFLFTFERTTITVEYRLLQENNDAQLVFIRFQNAVPGIWKIDIKPAMQTTGDFHIWLPMEEFLEGEVYFLESNPDTTFTEPSGGRNTMTVAFYNSRENGVDINSGRGYTRDEKIKPDYAAPGETVTGAVPGGGFKNRTGSSAATAIAAGGCALIMEWISEQPGARGVSSSQVRNIIVMGTQKLSGIEYPNTQWGYGTMNLYRSLDILRQL